MRGRRSQIDRPAARAAPSRAPHDE